MEDLNCKTSLSGCQEKNLEHLKDFFLDGTCFVFTQNNLLYIPCQQESSKNFLPI